MTGTKLKELLEAYRVAAEAADASAVAYRVAAYRVAYASDAAQRAAADAYRDAADADRVAVAAWDEYQAALKAAEKGGKP